MRDDGVRASSIAKTAGVSVIGLVLVVGWMLSSGSSAEYARPASNVVASEMPVDLSSIAASAQSEMATSDIAMIGPSVVGELVAQYENLKKNNSYTPENANTVAEQLGAAVIAPVPFKKYTAADIHTSPDDSYDAMLAYREQLKAALAPMAAQEEYELGVFLPMALKEPRGSLISISGGRRRKKLFFG